MELDAATVLEEAADLLLIRGRCINSRQSNSNRGTASYCVMDAIAEVAGITGTEVRPAWDLACDSAPALAVADHLADMESLPLWLRTLPAADRLWNWNDIHDANPENDFEIIDTLRLVAKDLRGKAVPS